MRNDRVGTGVPSLARTVAPIPTRTGIHPPQREMGPEAEVPLGKVMGPVAGVPPRKGPGTRDLGKNPGLE